MGKLLIIIFVLLVAGGLTFFLLQRKSSPEDTLQTPDEVAQETIQEKEVVTEEEGSLIEGIPEFPVYPGATVKKSYKKDIEGTNEFVVLWVTEGEVPKITSWYADVLKGQGWEVIGPDFPQAEDEQQIDAENDKYLVKLITLQETNEETNRLELLILVEFKVK